MTIIAADKHYLVVGLGLTGMSCVRFLISRNKKVSVVDSRQHPPGLAELKQTFPTVDVNVGDFDASYIAQFDVIVLSPGVPMSTPAIKSAVESGCQVTSDIELFLTEFKGQTVAVTGSNAKSTVVSWLGDALQRGGSRVLVAGNIGRPVLDALIEQFDIAVLELSSFQLELLPKVGADVATILNVSEDHLDRYPSFAHYQQAKQRIYFQCKKAIFNRDDVLTQPLIPDAIPKVSFGAAEPDLNSYGLQLVDGEEWLVFGFDPVMKVKQVSLAGRHNTVNALSVLALADAVGNDRMATIDSLKRFEGLPHRCQKIAEKNGVHFVDDSKATNVGSTIAALKGLSSKESANIIVLLGGQAKSQDLSPLTSALDQFTKSVIAFGEDRNLIRDVYRDSICVTTLKEATEKAVALADVGDLVLLSPACASFDQFKNFEERGTSFAKYVEALHDNS